jgi:hypothetical protein
MWVLTVTNWHRIRCFCFFVAAESTYNMGTTR